MQEKETTIATTVYLTQHPTREIIGGSRGGRARRAPPHLPGI